MIKIINHHQNFAPNILSFIYTRPDHSCSGCSRRHRFLGGGGWLGNCWGGQPCQPQVETKDNWLIILSTCLEKAGWHLLCDRGRRRRKDDFPSKNVLVGWEQSLQEIWWTAAYWRQRFLGGKDLCYGGSRRTAEVPAVLKGLARCLWLPGGGQLEGLWDWGGAWHIQVLGSRPAQWCENPKLRRNLGVWWGWHQPVSGGCKHYKN